MQPFHISFLYDLWLQLFELLAALRHHLQWFSRVEVVEHRHRKALTRSELLDLSSGQGFIESMSVNVQAPAGRC